MEGRIRAGMREATSSTGTAPAMARRQDREGLGELEHVGGLGCGRAGKRGPRGRAQQAHHALSLGSTSGKRDYLAESSRQPFEVGAYFPILQVSKLRPRKVTQQLARKSRPQPKVR